VVALVALDAGAYRLLDGGDDPITYWRCLNAAWGCNWLLQSHQGRTWCRSCRLTRGRPDNEKPDAVDAWAGAEVAKRLLVRHLATLGLLDDDVVFDLVHLPDSVGVTGHRPGVITLDLREVDIAYRERMRVQLGEADRTVLGHLRHEMGHHYWYVLVEQRQEVDAFRELFGDERVDYAEALAAHYERPLGPPPPSHVSHYATAHPSEDWAEVFAHYLALRDGMETAAEFGLLPPPGDFAATVSAWRRLGRALNQLNVGLGHPQPYPHVITAPVAAKLAFVHRLVEARQS
jgi:hypothetical protein